MFVLYREDIEGEKCYTEIEYIVEDREIVDEWMAKLNELEMIANEAFGTDSHWHWKKIDKISKEFIEPWYIENARKKLENV